MPKVKIEVDHLLTQKEAIERLKDNCNWAHTFSDLKENWSGNTMEFSATIQGIKVSGKIEVDDTALKMDGTIPLIALPFKSWIPNILRNAIKPRKLNTEVAAIDSTRPLLLYLHIPKAGGTTLGEFIYNQCQNGNNNDEGLIKNGVFFTQDGFFRNKETDSSDQFHALQREDLRALIGHFAFGIHKHLIRPFKYVTILREPVSRVISLYHYLKLENTMSLEDFATSSTYREVENDQTRRIAGINPEIDKCNEGHLETAKQNLRQYFSVVGVTERIDEALVLLTRNFNWTRSFGSYPKNVNSAAKNGVSPTAQAIEAIRKRNQLDFSLYSYANQLMDEMIADHGEDFYVALNEQKKINAFVS